MRTGFLSVVLFLNNAAAQLFEETQLTTEECRELGFNRASLHCDTCKLLPKHNLEMLLTDCQRCCKKSTISHEIEVCECNLQRFPQVNAFVKSELSGQWGSKLQVKHVRGTLPTIVLKGADGKPKKTLNIEKWDTDTITEFVNDWLE